MSGGLLLLIVGQALVAGCASQGLLTEKYEPEAYEIPAQLPDNVIDNDVPFIVYGDNRPGWRGIERFWSKKAWATWWQLAVPFYQIYLLGNAAVGGINKLREVPDYGDRDAERVRNAIYDAAVREGVGFIVNTGDIATDGRRPRHWRHFVEQNRDDVPLVTDFPYLPVAGNHERANDDVHGAPNYQSVFGRPNFYVFQTPNVDLFLVDSNVIIDQYGYIDDAEQDRLFEEWFVSPDADRPSWLERKLSESRKPFKIVVLHHPPVAYSKHYANWSDPANGANLEEKRIAFVRLLQRYQVEVVFCGHQHMYEHNVIEPGDAGKPIHIIVTGGGGAPLHAATSQEEEAAMTREFAQQGLRVRNEEQVVIHNYCLVEAGPGRLSIRAYGVSKDPLADGRLLDDLVITR